ncbi:hypothetical protein FNU76_18090 [Chitinimonas arctica]|uniref:Uncharacterized protein n=1 Tax=Chitinimonas arctica TaxID=2594795 RepID=A0A516SIX1_9NEIS|nr:hypothetical protein [Chitinimonas arctica]QDQ28102.1 hypothetical protein FNU76_18090 [Chitinimonas arctica]
MKKALPGYLLPNTLVVLGSVLLAACGGGGDSDGGDGSGLPPTSAQISLVGPAQEVQSYRCGSEVGAAEQARYPRDGLTLRQDYAGGLMAQEIGGVYRIDAQGRKTLIAQDVGYALRFFDVAPDGSAWLVYNGYLAVRDSAGVENKLTDLANHNDSSPQPDGPLGSQTLGHGLWGMAVGSERVYFGSAGGFRAMSKDGSGAWQLSTLPPIPLGQVPPDEAGKITAVDMETDAQGRLWVLRDHRTQREVRRDANNRVYYKGEATLWNWSAADGWRRHSSLSYDYEEDLFARQWTAEVSSLAVRADGKILVASARTGVLHEVGNDGQWRVIHSPEGRRPFEQGMDGDLANAAAITAYSPVAMPDGATVFYDTEHCQVRRLAQGKLTTLSGPKGKDPANFTGAALLGVDADGQILYTRHGWAAGYASGNSYSQLARYSLTSRQSSPVALSSTMSAPYCDSYAAMHQRFNACAARWEEGATGEFIGFDPQQGRIYLKDGDHQLAAWPLSANSPVVDRIADRPLQPLLTLPANAESYWRVGELTANYFNMFKYQRVPSGDGLVHYEPQLYRIDRKSGALQAVAGKSVDSAQFGGKRISLVDEANGTGQLQVAARHDGGYWFANNNGVSLLDAAGELKVVVRGRLGSDYTADSRNFGMIAEIHALPDGRLLVVDLGAHAIRTVSETGTIETLVGTLNQAGFGAGALPGKLDAPMSVAVHGRDLFISSVTHSQLVHVKNLFK